MKLTNLLFLLLLLPLTMTAGRPVTLDDVVGGTFRAHRPMAVTPMPDGEHYACLEKGRVVEHAYKTGKETAVLFDAATAAGAKIDKAERFILSPDGTQMLIATKVKSIYRHSYSAVWYTYNIQGRKLVALSDGGPQQSPVWSPDGTQVAFVRDNNIFLVKLLYDNAESQVTKDGRRNAIINGIPDWVNEEEFALATSMAFTADGSQICWIRYDETAVPTYALQTFKGMAPERKEQATYPGLYEYKYPKAGERNATVSAWSYDTKTKKAQQLQLPLDEDGYICRLFPTADAQQMVFVTLNRHQDLMSIYTVNPRSTVARLVTEERAKCYVIEEAYTEMTVEGNSVLFLSDRDGRRHLYQYSLTGTLQRSLTPANTDITTVYGVAENGDIYYQAAPTPQTRHIYVAHKNGRIQQLSTREGTNSAAFSATMAYYTNTFSDRNTPYIVTTNTAQGRTINTVEDNAELCKRLAEIDIPTRELFTLTTSEGIELNGYMLRPVGFTATKRYPVVMHQYSGPASQQVVDSWSMGSCGEGASYDAYLCSLGYIVVVVDGRGTGMRGADFEKCTYLNLGRLEAKDQVETAQWLARQQYVDKDRIAIWGWSFGGFCTLMAMSEGTPVFAAGVAVAPPTSWRYYDTIYTERFMRTPKENPDGYAECPISRAKALHGSLLICHGTADDNVHPQNTFEYNEALVQADKDFRSLYYTNRNHGISGGNTRRHLLRQVTQHFQQAFAQVAE